MAETIPIAEAAEDCVTLETCELTDAFFAGGADGIARDRGANPFLGWRASPTTLRAWRLRDVVLDRDHMVLLKDGRVLAETVYLQSPDSIAALRVDPDRLERPGIAGVAATCFDHWDANYYHWLAHSVPTVHAIRSRHGDAATLIVPRLWPWQAATLDRLGAGGMRRLPTELGRKYALAEAEYYEFAAGRADFSVSALSRAAYERMAEGIAPEPPMGRRLYIDRGNAANRRIPNEAALVAALRARGFEIVRPEERDIDGQIALFRAAGMVVGQLGAGLANIAFCRPGTVVYEIVPEHHANPCFLAMAMQSGLRYWADLFPTGAAQPDHTSAWHADIDVAAVLRRIGELEAFVPR
ncbi:MAG: glycosyltransferase family 61 protein [Proteobacteria bacterium]|nr:glycosyltransferase family 61 protein [Pseudomonadota bacterium]